MSVEHREKIPAIIGMGKAVGRREITNSDMDTYLGVKSGATDRMMRAGPGIKTRYWVETGQQATSDLCVEALQEALEDAGIESQDLKAIWVATSSPDYLGVSVAAMVQHKLGLSRNIAGSTNQDACPGWILAAHRAVTVMTSPYGIKGPQAVIGAETISTSLSPKKGVVSALFGDAAGATIFDMVEPDEGAPTEIGFAIGLDGQYAEELGIEAGGSRMPASHETVDGHRHAIHMNGPLVFSKATENMPQVLDEAAKNSGLPRDAIDIFVFHQANGEIIIVSANKLNIPLDKVIITIDRYGNTSAASIPTALYEAYKEGKLRRNDRIGVASFGAGFIYAAAVLPMVGLRRQ